MYVCGDIGCDVVVCRVSALCVLDSKISCFCCVLGIGDCLVLSGRWRKSCVRKRERGEREEERERDQLRDGYSEAERS